MFFLDGLRQELRDLVKFRMVVESFVVSSLRLRYKRSVLGVAWTLLGPAMNYLIMGFVFSHLARGNQENYFTFLFSGAVVFSFFSMAINLGPGALINNEGYLKKIYLPKSLFIANVVLGELVNFLLAFAALIILGVIFGGLTFSWHFLLVPIVVVTSVFFLFGINCVLAVMSVYFRDLMHVVPLLMQASFFATPILYPAESAPSFVKAVLPLNPIYYFVEVFRAAVLRNAMPPEGFLLAILVMGPAMALLGLMFLKHFDNKILFKM